MERKSFILMKTQLKQIRNSGEEHEFCRAVDDDGVVKHWRLWSPGSNNGRIAFVMGKAV
jgi:hypothetical protein